MTSYFTQAPVIDQQFLDINGNPLAAGQVWTYLAGTNTLTATYTDGTGTALATNPIILDSGGFTQIFLSISNRYKFVVMDSMGATQYTIDEINPIIPLSIISSIQAAIDANTAAIAILQGGSATTLTLTGAVTGSGNIASPITTTLANTAVTAGSYTNSNITVNSKGQITAASNGSSGSSGITALTGDVTASGSGSVAATLASTAVTPGAYTNASITVDAKGRVTAASSGSGSGSGIGYGQTWQNLTYSRSMNTLYTNSTGKPIMVSVSTTDGGSGSTGIGTFLIDSVDCGNMWPATGQFTIIVPVGSTYNVVGTGGAIYVQSWCELR